MPALLPLLLSLLSPLTFLTLCTLPISSLPAFLLTSLVIVTASGDSGLARQHLSHAHRSGVVFALLCACFAHTHYLM